MQRDKKAEAGGRDLEVQGVASDQNSHCTLVSGNKISEHKMGCRDKLPGHPQTSKNGAAAAERKTYVERLQA